jgi:5-methylcytosine-specific restriction endonuclease McrA
MSIFNKNKYTIWYQNIVLKAKDRSLVNTYTETHHIIPKSLGGDNSKENLVKLTAREHFLCHYLLTKMTTGQSQIKMCFAFNAFRRSSGNQERQLTGHQYEIIRQSVSTARSEFLKGNTYNLGKKRGPLSEETKKKISDSKKGKPMSEEQKTKISQTTTGRKKSEETKQRMRKPKPAGHGEKVRLARLGTTLSSETKLKISKSHKKLHKSK